MSVVLVFLNPLASGFEKETGAIGAHKDMFTQLPFQNLPGPDEIKKDFVRLEFTPLGDPELKMFFLAPKDWKTQPITVKKKTLKRDHMTTVPLVLVTSPKLRARIEVNYTRVPEAVDLKEWSLAYLKGNRLKLLNSQPGEFSGRKVFDTLVKAPKGEHVRMTFSRHKDRIVIFACSTAKLAYPEFAQIFGLATVSFKMAS